MALNVKFEISADVISTEAQLEETLLMNTRTLGYFGLGLAPESPDWGTAIKDASRLLRQFIHPALPPTIALMSFVLGLNLLADALREQSMKD